MKRISITTIISFIVSIIICSFIFIVLLYLYVNMNTIKGDANNDGVVDTKDIIYIKRYMLDYDKHSIIEKVRMDVNRDFKIDEDDIMRVREIIVGL